MQYDLLLNLDGTAQRWCVARERGQCSAAPVEILVHGQTTQASLTPAMTAIETVTQSEIATALTWHPEDSVTLIVPGSDVTVYTVVLPANLRRARLAQAIPYALEEMLGTDIDACHFAIANKMHEGQWPVAVVDKARMAQWLQPLQSLGIRILAVIPDFLAIPAIADGWHIVLQSDRAICRTNETVGFTVDRSLFSTFLLLHLAQSKKPPQRIILSGPDAQTVAATLSGQCPQAIIADRVEAPVQLFSSLMEGLAQAPALNLCQGEFQQKIPKNGYTRVLWSAAVLTVLCCVSLFAGQFAQIVYFNQKNRALDHEIAQVYRQAYPQSSRVVTPRERIEKEMKSYADSPEHSTMINLLVEVGQALPRSASSQIQRLQFTQQQLQMQLKFNSFEEMNAVIKVWQKNKIAVKQEQANNVGEGVIATITLKRNAQ